MISIQFSDAYERRFLLENDGMQFQQTTDCEGENDINCFRPGFSARFRSVTFPLPQITLLMKKFTYNWELVTKHLY